MVKVTIYIIYLISLCILHNSLPEPILYSGINYLYFLCRSNSSSSPTVYLYLYWYFCTEYNGVCICMFIYVIQSNCCLYFILGILSYISPMCGLFFHFIVVTFVFLLICWGMEIFMFTAVCWCTSKNILLGCTPSWWSCHKYLLHSICYTNYSILIDLHLKNWINMSFFELVVPCIETHINVSVVSYS